MEIEVLNIPKNKITQFESANIFNVEDLLRYLPKKYYDFRIFDRIENIPNILAEGREDNTIGIVARIVSKELLNKGKILKVKANDGSGTIHLTWFNSCKVIYNALSVNQEYFFMGTPTINPEFHNIKQMVPTLFSSKWSNYNRIIPIYKKIKGMSIDYLLDMIDLALTTINQDDYLDKDIKSKFTLIDLYAAFKQTHQPTSFEDIRLAKKRFIFDDLFLWNFILKSKQPQLKETNYPTSTCKVWHTLTKELPFELTADQIKTLKNIYHLMKNKKTVNALIQGDVGSGKTIVAEFLLSLMAEQKFQSCLIAPTEILASQHYKEIVERFKNCNIKVGYLTGSLKVRERKTLLKELKNGEIDVIIGTHSIMSKDVYFKNLGLVICDEEHRFGVLQREFFKKDDDFYIENLDFVSLLNTKLKKFKKDKANVFWRNINLKKYDVEKELSIFKDIEKKDVDYSDLKKEVGLRLIELKKEQQRILNMKTDPKYSLLYKDLILNIDNEKELKKLTKNLSFEDLYILYIFHAKEIKKELSKEIHKPHQITMSATPIPRTLAMTIYGDTIKVFTIKSKPSGRKPIITKTVKNDIEVNEFMKKEIRKGHQAYVICPLIEDSKSEKMLNIDSVFTTYDKLVEYFKNDKDISIAMIYGENKNISSNLGSTNDEILQDFSNNKYQILVCTTIIEVGVNVPNATVIVIKNSERFGLASSHQIRGRVGRGSHQSYCLLQPININEKKAKVLCSTTDGFEISKADLEMRGPGSFLGTRQSGDDKYISLMLLFPNMYQHISILNDHIYSTPALYEKYKHLLNSKLEN